MIRYFFTAFILLYSAIYLSSCNNGSYDLPGQSEPEIDQTLLNDVAFLSADSLQGRRTGTEGNRLAREFILQRFESLDLQPVNGSLEQEFTNPLSNQLDGLNESVNIVGMIEGKTHPDRYILVTAHYDHLGVENGQIFNGADDNASGVAGMLAAAKHFSDQKPEHSFLFVAFDAEEEGLAGAKYFTENPLKELNQIRLVVNLDMISVNTSNRFIASGTAHYPFTRPYVEKAAASSSLEIIFGYDSDEWPQNWTFSSDHGPFHQEGVPYIYFGVEDHEHYHQPSDTIENIDPPFFKEAVRFILNFLETSDENL